MFQEGDAASVLGGFFDREARILPPEQFSASRSDFDQLLFTGRNHLPDIRPLPLPLL